MPRPPRHLLLPLAALITGVVLASLVWGSLRVARTTARVPQGTTASPAPIPAVELRFRARLREAPTRKFQRALDQLVTALRAEGLRIGRVAPRAQEALLDVPGLDGTRLDRALAALPLAVEPSVSAPSEITVRLREGEVERAAEEALQETLRQVRARVETACPHCAPSVLARGDEVVLRLPWLDDATEQRLRDAVLAEPQPVPLEFLGARTLR